MIRLKRKNEWNYYKGGKIRGCQKKSIYDRPQKIKIKKVSEWWDNTVKDIPGRENSVMMASCCPKKKGHSVWQGAGERLGVAYKIDWGQIPKTYCPLPRNFWIISIRSGKLLKILEIVKCLLL